MTQLDITPKQIKSKSLHFDNEEYCITNQSDDCREGYIEYCSKTQYYWIYFNGKFIYHAKTFKSVKTRLEKLMFDWNLKFTP